MYIPRVGIDAPYDMGWEKKSSGHKFGSPSDHGFLVDCRSCRVLSHVSFSNWCRSCDTAKRKMIAPPQHIYPKIYEAKYLKSMETDGDVALVSNVHLQ